MKIINRLVYLRKWRIVREILALYCIEIPATVKIGNNFELIHRGFGTVIHPNTIIGNNVKIFHGVTIGRADAYTHGSRSMMKSIVIGDDAVICPGAVILGGPGVTSVGKGTVIAANAVLTVSTGEHEIWGGYSSAEAVKQAFVVNFQHDSAISLYVSPPSSPRAIA